MRPLPNIADITYPKAGRRTNGGAYCGNGALQIDESRSSPRGCWAGGATLPEADAIFCRISGFGKVAHTPFAPGRARGENSERRQKHEQSQTNPKRSGQSSIRILQETGSAASSSLPEELARAARDWCAADMPPRRRNKQFRQPGESKMPDHHRRNRDVQRIRSVQRGAGCVFEKQRLNSQFARSQKRRSIDGGVPRQCAGRDPARGRERESCPPQAGKPGEPPVSPQSPC